MCKKFLSGGAEAVSVRTRVREVENGGDPRG